MAEESGKTPSTPAAPNGRDAGGHHSLPEVHGSVSVPSAPGFWRRLFAFAGPAYLVSVGYMDPGNWATDIAAGSQYGYALLWVLVMSNLMAILLQSLSARMGIVAGLDLAQACRAMFNRRVSFVLWILCELAIAACDLAEVLGAAIGLQLLFGLPLIAGVVLMTFDTLLLLALHQRGMRIMEAFIVALVTTIGVCLAVEIFLSKPEAGALVRGLVPSLPGDNALYLAIGILGATVMPHNLYLHSALVQSRRIKPTPAGIWAGIRYNVIDSVVALNGALFVNGALLVMAAAAFHRAGLTGVTEIQDAHRLLEPILGASLAPVAFAVALLAAGQSSTITGTLAGQIVMEGFIRLRLTPLARRLVTRAVAIIPAMFVIIAFGESAVGDLLILSQVVLSLQLSFAVIPLIHFVSDRRWMGQYRIKTGVTVVAWVMAAVIAALNLKLATEEVIGWTAAAGTWGWLVKLTVIPAGLGLVGLLGYVTVVPILHRRAGRPLTEPESVHGAAGVPDLREAPTYKRIAVAVDFTEADGPALSHALGIAQHARPKPSIVLLHVVESGGSRLVGDDLDDREARTDRARLELYAAELEGNGATTSYDLGFGSPADALAALTRQSGADLLVLGSHGHRGVQDVLWGTTIGSLRHKLDIPVLVAPTRTAKEE